MNAVGLSVAPVARGRGLGLLLLKGRLEVCRGLRIPLTKTVFTAIQSQKLAAKAEKEYEQIKDESGHVLFPNMAPTKNIQLSARTIP
jgi:predicted acetyltransferase